MAPWWTRRRQLLPLVLGLLLALLAVVVWRTSASPAWTCACAPPPNLTPAVHSTYLFTIQSFPPGPLQAGAHMQVQWSPSLSPRANSNIGPLPVVCTFVLFGPYASAEAVTQAMDSGDTPPGDPVFAVPPLTLSDWDADPYPVEIVLPLTLIPGYYIATNRSVRDFDHTTSGGGALVQIGA